MRKDLPAASTQAAVACFLGSYLDRLRRMVSALGTGDGFPSRGGPSLLLRRKPRRLQMKRGLRCWWRRRRRRTSAAGLTYIVHCVLEPTTQLVILIHGGIWGKEPLTAGPWMKPLTIQIRARGSSRRYVVLIAFISRPLGLGFCEFPRVWIVI